MKVSAFGLNSVWSHVWVCVKDLSWHPNEEPAPREMTGNSKRVRWG